MAYAGTAELARLLKLRNPSAEQGTAMQVCLDAAWYEINSECLGDGTVEFGTPYPALAVRVNVDRAVEHWQQGESPWGIIGVGTEALVHTAKEPFDRHANKLAPLKTTWGIA